MSVAAVVAVPVGVAVEIGSCVFSGVGDAESVAVGSGVSLGTCVKNNVTVGGTSVGAASGVTEGRSAPGVPTSLVTTRRGISVIMGVPIVMVESMGGKVGIAPHEDSSTVMNRSIRSFRIDFIIFSLL
jgi:hypothetical protein